MSSEHWRTAIGVESREVKKCACIIKATPGCKAVFRVAGGFQYADAIASI
jgi:hypothetical protein